MLKRFWVVGSLAAVTAVFACSGTTGGSGINACLAAASPSQACTSCVESKCSAAANMYTTGCADYASCACPGGSYSVPAASSTACQQKLTEASCQSAQSAVGSCIQSSCPSECSGGSGSGSGGASSGSGSGFGSSSNGSGGGSGSSGGAIACEAQSTSQVCLACVEATCTSQLTSYNNACVAYVACVCPGGNYSASAAASAACQQLVSTGPCQAAETSIGQCISSSCTTACSVSSSSSSSGSSSGGSSGSSSGGVSGTTFSCTSTSGTTMTCVEYKNVPAADLASLMSSCTGTAGTACSPAGLVGCCTLTSTSGGITTEACYYPPTTAATGMSACASIGTWSTSP